jgi:hypothetical protein
MPFDVTINAGASFNGAFNLVGNTQTWTPSGVGSNVNGETIQAFLNAGNDVVIRTADGGGAEPGNIIYDFNTHVVHGNATLRLEADNSITLASNIFGPNLSLALSGLTALTPGGVAGIQVKALNMNLVTGCTIGNPPGLTVASVNGATDGSTVQFLNNIQAGTHFFNGVDLSYYLAAQAAPNATEAVDKGATASASSSSTAPSTASTSTTAAANQTTATASQSAASNTAAPVTTAFNASTSAAASKTDKDKLDKDKHDSSASKPKK